MEMRIKRSMVTRDSIFRSRLDELNAHIGKAPPDTFSVDDDDLGDPVSLRQPHLKCAKKTSFLTRNGDRKRT